MSCGLRIVIDDPSAKKAKVGDKVVVDITSWGGANFFANGVITEKLGKSGLDKVELKAVICRYGLDEKFSRASGHDAKAAIAGFDPQALIDSGEYDDIRDKTILTIDPASARDFDDAISLQKLPGDRYKLGVHIADVSRFVVEDTHLDKQAKQRATSTYLPGYVHCQRM